MSQSKLRVFARIVLLALACLTVGLAPTAYANPNIQVNEVTAGGWSERHFVAVSNGNPVSGTIDVTAAVSGVTVEVFNGSSWTTVSTGSSASGTKVRANGEASATFRPSEGPPIDIEIESWS